jgi:hypothetical protein
MGDVSGFSILYFLRFLFLTANLERLADWLVADKTADTATVQSPKKTAASR